MFADNQDVLANSIFVNVAELKGETFTKDRSIYERLKAWLTDPFMRVKEFQQKEYMMENHLRMLFNANKIDGLPMDADERRFMVLDAGDTEPLGDEFYLEVRDKVVLNKTGLAQVATYLHRNHNHELPVRAPTYDIANVGIERSVDWIETLNERVAEKYTYPVTVKASDMQAVARMYAPGTNDRQIKREVTENGWTRKKVKLNGAVMLVYFNGADHNDHLTDDFVSKVQPVSLF